MIKRLLRVLLLALLCSAPALAQIDTPIGQIGPYIDLARNQAWSNFATAGIDYLFTPITPDQGVCVYIYPLTGSGSATLTVFQTGDQTVHTYTGNTASWVQVGNAITLSSTAIGNYLFKASGAAKMAVLVNSGTGTGTLNIISVQTTQSCGPQSNVPLQAYNSAFLAGGGVAANGAPSLLVNEGAIATKRIHIVSYHITGTSSVAGPIGGNVQFEFGTTAVTGCDTGPQTSWAFVTPNGFYNFALTASGGELFEGPPGRDLCIVNNGTTGSLYVAVDYAIY